MEATLLSLELKQRYEQQWSKVEALADFPLSGRYQMTSLGPVWLMEAGPADAPPLLALHGLHTPAPFNQELLRPLCKHFRVITPDIPGQAGKTPGAAPIPSGRAYAVWLDALLDSLDIRSCPMVGLSFGCALILDLAAYKPSRIDSASLLVPAGFFRPLWRPVKKLLFPLLNFKIHTDLDHFDKLMDPLIGDNWPELEAYYYAVLQAGIPMTLLPPGPYDAEQLSQFEAPVQLVVAEDDVYFSPDKLLSKARGSLVNLVDEIRIDDLHIPNEKHRSQIQGQVVEFMLKCRGM